MLKFDLNKNIINRYVNMDGGNFINFIGRIIGNEGMFRIGKIVIFGEEYISKCLGL